MERSNNDMEEIEMVKRLGVALDDPDVGSAMARAREALRIEVDRRALQTRRWSVRPKHALIAAALVAASLGGIAIATGDGAGVGDPAADKIPFVQERIDSIHEQLSGLDTSTEEGAAKAAYLNRQLTAVQQVLANLCAEAGQPEGC
jgi:hypothetical protein